MRLPDFHKDGERSREFRWRVRTTVDSNVFVGVRCHHQPRERRFVASIRMVEALKSRPYERFAVQGQQIVLTSKVSRYSQGRFDEFCDAALAALAADYERFAHYFDPKAGA